MWIKQSRELTVSSLPLVTFRKEGLAFNASSAKHLLKYVEIFFNEDNTKIGFKFSDSETKDSYKVQPDGGGNRSNVASSYLVTCTAVLKTIPFFNDFCKRKVKLELYKDAESNIYYISLSGEFIYNTEQNPVMGHYYGVYRYISEGEIVYIGQGNISSRLKDPSRSEWIFDCIEYLLEDSEERRFSLEKENLDIFLNKHNRLPIYNRIRGKGNV